MQNYEMSASQVQVSSSVTVPEWTIREQLVLASAVQRSGDQNWVSVSRSVKPLVEDVRPADYFSQKNCALQYAAMLDKVSTPNKRKKRVSEEGTETAEQQIVRELSEKRIGELNVSLAGIRKEYLALAKEAELLENGEMDDKVPELWDKLKHESSTEGQKHQAEGASMHPSKQAAAPKQPSPRTSAQETQDPAFPTKESAPTIKPTNEAAGHAVSAAVKVTPTPTPNVPQSSIKEKSFTIKKELPPPPTDVENPLARLSYIGDEKPLSPMQTPQPTSSGQPLSANLHIIVQQRNEAMDSLLAKGIIKSAEVKPSLPAASTTVPTSAVVVPTHKTTPPVPKQHPAPSTTTTPTVSSLPVTVVATSKPALLSSTTPKTQVQIPSAPKTQVQTPSAPKTQVQTLSTPKTQVQTPNAPKAQVQTPNAPKAQVQTPSAPKTQVQTPSAPKTQVQTSSTPKAQPQVLGAPKTHTHSSVSMTFLPPMKTSSQVQSSLSSHLPKSVPIMAYLSKTQGMSQPHKVSVLQSLVSASSHSLLSPSLSAGSGATASPSAAVTASPSPPTSSPVVSLTASRLPSPLVSRTTPIASLIKLTPPISIGASLSSSLPASKPPVVMSQPPIAALSQPPTSSLQPTVRAVVTAAVTPPVTIQKVVDSQPPKIPSKVTPLFPDAPLKKPPQPAPLATTKEVAAVKITKSEGTKDIKTLLTLPPSGPKPPVKVEVSQETKQPSGQESSSSSTNQEATISEAPSKVETSPVKAEPENKQQAEVAMDTVSTPISSPPSTVGSATPSVVMETPDGELEEDTPTKVRKGRSILQRTLLTRSRKRKVEDEGQSVESTDTEEDGLSSQATSAVPSPAPSQSGEMDADALRAHKQWKKGIMIVWRHAAQHKYANFFLHPVREEDAPGYKDIILSPTDLYTIKRKVESGVIKSDIEFQREMLLMFQNAFMYNSSDHEIYQMAQDMKSDVMENLQTYLATQAQIQLVEDPVPTKTLRGRRGDRDHSHDDSLFSPATKKRRTRNDDRD